MCAETETGEKLREVLYGKSNIFQYSTTKLPDDCDFAAIQTLYRKTWFGRLWVVQEAALCTSGVVVCGEHEMGLIELMRASVWIQHKQHQLPFDLDKESGMLNASYMSAHVDREQGWFSPKYGLVPFLADLLQYFRPFGVSEPRDKIYALLGMTRWVASGHQLPKTLIPRYQEDILVVFRDATRIAIEESKDLWILRYVEHGSMADFGSDLPSWVPALFRESNPDRDPNPLRSTFRANKSLARYHSIPSLLRDSDPDKLFANGLEVAKIQAVGNILGSEAKPIPDVQQLLYRTLVERSINDESSPGALRSVSIYNLVLALVGGSTFDPDPTQTKTDTLKDSIFIRFVSALGDECEAIKHNTSEQRENDFVGIFVQQEFSRCLWAVRFACTNRRLFFTDTGRIGLGPQSLQVGDSVCALSGSRIPMVLRPAATEFEVVGPCYIDGMMQGEVAAGMTERQIEHGITEFVLR